MNLAYPAKLDPVNRQDLERLISDHHLLSRAVSDASQRRTWRHSSYQRSLYWLDLAGHAWSRGQHGRVITDLIQAVREVNDDDAPAFGASTSGEHMHLDELTQVGLAGLIGLGERRDALLGWSRYPRPKTENPAAGALFSSVCNVLLSGLVDERELDLINACPDSDPLHRLVRSYAPMIWSFHSRDSVALAESYLGVQRAWRQTFPERVPRGALCLQPAAGAMIAIAAEAGWFTLPREHPVVAWPLEAYAHLRLVARDEYGFESLI